MIHLNLKCNLIQKHAKDTKSLKSVKSEGSNVSYFGAFTNTTSDEVIKANKVFVAVVVMVGARRGLVFKDEILLLY